MAMMIFPRDWERVFSRWGGEGPAAEGFASFIAQNQGIARLHHFEQGLRFLGFLGFGIGGSSSGKQFEFYGVHWGATLHIIVTKRIDFRIFVVFDGGNQDHPN